MSFLGLFGGDKTTSTTTATTNNYNDQRQVNDASGGGVIGSGNAFDNSQTFNTSDSGNTTTTLNTKDSGNVTTTNNLQVVDNGAVDGSFNAVNKTVSKAFDFGTDALGLAGRSVDSSLDFGANALNKSYTFADHTVGAAFDTSQLSIDKALSFAKDAQARSFAQVSDGLQTVVDSLGKALNFGANQTKQVADSFSTTTRTLDNAYADAKGRGAMTDYLLLAAIAAVGIVGFVALRKGRA